MPACRAYLMTVMMITRITTAASTIPVDVCTACSYVWFDPKEYAAVTLVPKEAAAPAKLVDVKWKWLPALFGLPVEREYIPLGLRPWATWTLAGAIVVISFLAFAQFQQSILRFGLVPAQFWRYGGLTLLTSFFLHGGLLHLFSNIYYLIVFGDNVEDYLGRARFLLLLLVSSLAGDVLHALLDPQSRIPVVGASGGISGIVMFYGLMFPRARLLVLLPRLLFWPLRMHARTALFLWILLQAVGAWLQLAGFSNVSALSHLGGASVGLLYWLKWRKN